MACRFPYIGRYAPHSGNARLYNLLALTMFTELNNAQRRQFVDVIQAFEAWEESRAELARRFVGSMRWVERRGKVYLLRKRANSEVSLGRKTDETEKIYQAFRNGRDEERNRSRALDARLKEMAPVNRALRLNRVPRITSRILRHLANAQILGRSVFVVGTNSLYLYEALAGVQLKNELLTTEDVDLLWDTRQGLTLAVKGFHRAGVLGYLKRADSSFGRGKRQKYRAINRDGFRVDLINPVNEIPSDANNADHPEDLIGTGTEGLAWLVNTPKVNGVVIGADGLPLRCWSVDPRAFVLHKAWVSQRIDRDPLRRARDLAHAREVAGIAKHYLGMRFSNLDLSALPVFMRQFANQFDDG